MELYSHEAEQIILGSLLNKPESLPAVSKTIHDTSFYFDKHRLVWGAILSLQNDSVIPDIITVGDFLEKSKKLDYVGGVSYLAELVSKSIGFPNLLHYAEIIREKENLRNFWEFFITKADDIKTGKITDYQKILQETSDKILSLNSGNIETHTNISDICQLYTKLQEEYAEKKAQGIDFLGIPTKYASLDRATEGFQKENLWTIAAFTSIGKSSFMINLAKKLLNQNKRVCIFSLEMSKEELFSKLMAIEIDLSPHEITKGLLNNETYAKQLLAKQKLNDQKISIYTECSSVEEILLSMRAEMLKEHVDVFFIDYIQNITSQKIFGDQFKIITAAVKNIQTLTRKLKTTTVLLSQISNESNKVGGTLEVGGKDSGSIRAASNVFIYLKREGTEEEILERYRTGQDIPLKLIVNKNRMGRIGSFSINLKQESGKMYEPL
jgi:replicative DNA helicase